MTQHTLNKHTVLSVEVPEGATKVCWECGSDGRVLRYYPKNYNDIHDSRRIELPPGQWELLGVAGKIEESKWKELVVPTASKSGLSWCKANNIKLTDVLLLKK